MLKRIVTGALILGLSAISALPAQATDYPETTESSSAHAFSIKPGKMVIVPQTEQLTGLQNNNPIFGVAFDSSYTPPSENYDYRTTVFKTPMFKGDRFNPAVSASHDGLPTQDTLFNARFGNLNSMGWYKYQVVVDRVPKGMEFNNELMDYNIQEVADLNEIAYQSDEFITILHPVSRNLETPEYSPNNS